MFGSRPPQRPPKPAPELYGPPAPAPRPKIPLTRAQKTMRMVCELFDITKAQLLGPCRIAHLVDARQFAVVRLSRDLGLSTSTIGNLLNRDHTSIMHLLRRAKMFDGMKHDVAKPRPAAFERFRTIQRRGGVTSRTDSRVAIRMVREG